MNGHSITIGQYQFFIDVDFDGKKFARYYGHPAWGESETVAAKFVSANDNDAIVALIESLMLTVQGRSIF